VIPMSLMSRRPPASGRKRSVLRRWGRDSQGTTAIEFAVVALPFFFFSFGIMGLGLHFFTSSALENAVEQAARKIRTGQAQKEGKTLNDFKNMVCTAATGYIKCDTSLRVHIQSGANWSNIVPRPCLSNGALNSSAGSSTDLVSSASGGASQAVLVTVCYEWTLAQKLPFLMMGDLANGSALIQASSTFRTEPYQ